MLIDIDGTLVLSNDAHAYAWVDAFAEFGYNVAFDKVRPLIGMGSDKLVPTLFPDLSAEQGTGKELADRRGEIFLEKYILSVKPAPGARALIHKLHEKGIKTVVASSANSKDIESLLSIADVNDLLTIHTSSSDVDNSKPDPDIVVAALKKIELPPKEVLMLGDTPYDIASAEICDISVVAVRCGGFPEESLKGAWKIYDTPEEVLNNLDELLNSA